MTKTIMSIKSALDVVGPEYGKRSAATAHLDVAAKDSLFTWAHVGYAAEADL